MDEDELDVGFITKWILRFIVLLFAIIIVFGSFFVVDAGHRGVLLTWGAVSDTVYNEGIHMKFPFAQKAISMSVQTLKYEAEASAATKDLLDVKTKVAVNYHVDAIVANKLYQSVGLDYENKVIYPAVQEEVKATTAKFDATNLILDRSTVKDRIEQALKERVSSRGIIVETISITDFTFPSQFNDAITAKQTAIQRAIEAENKLKQIEFEAKQAAAAAQGQADAIELINKQLEKSPQYIQYLATTKWDGKLPLATGGVLPFIDINSK